MNKEEYEGFETATRRTSYCLFYYKFKNLHHSDGSAEGYEKDGLDPDSVWIKQDFRIRPDGSSNMILSGFRGTIAMSQRGIQDTTKSRAGRVAVVKGVSNFTMELDNNFKKALIENSIKIGPYINKLIEEDLIKRDWL